MDPQSLFQQYGITPPAGFFDWLQSSGNADQMRGLPPDQNEAVDWLNGWVRQYQQAAPATEPANNPEPTDAAAPPPSGAPAPTPSPTGSPAPAPAPTGAPGADLSTQGLIGGTIGSVLNTPYAQPMPSQPNPVQFPTFQQAQPMGGYTPPPAFNYQDFRAPDPFHAPTAEEVQQEPGYAFRRQQGEDSIQRSAAAKGLLNSGGTIKDFLDYNQNYASNEYQNAFNRDAGVYNTNLGTQMQTYAMNRGNALDAYNTNYKTNYVDPFTFNKDLYQANYQTQTLDPYSMNRTSALDQSNQNQGLYGMANSAFLNDRDYYQKWQNDVYDRLYKQQRLGLDASQ